MISDAGDVAVRVARGFKSLWRWWDVLIGEVLVGACLSRGPVIDSGAVASNCPLCAVTASVGR
jgi:hypothetical protein